MPRFLILLSLILLLAACSTGSQTNPPSGGVPVKFGATAALTGNLAFHGIDEQIGYDLALAEINQQGGILGRPIEVIYEDNQGDAAKGVTTVKKLLEIDRVDFILSAYTHVTQAVEPIVTAAGKVMFYAASTKDMAARSKYAFRDWADNVEGGLRLGQLLKKRGQNKLAYAGSLDESCNLALGGIKQADVTFLREEKYQPTAKDTATEILNMKKSGATAFVFCDWRDATPNMKALKELGLIKTPTYHVWGHFAPQSNTSEMNALWLENKTIDAFYGPELDSPRATEKKAMENDFRQKYGREPRPDVWFAYDRLFIIKRAVEACGAIDQNCIATKIENSEYEGISGKVRFDEQGVSWRAVVIQQYGPKGWAELGR